ncbi:MAG TPA: NRDE family protein [Spirochaetia bacterium]|nr:NRDE family protein [Spirochaetia bacterium]
MCLILCAHHAHPRYDLVIAANRDEFLNRPTLPADWWEDHPELLAGRDLEQMGTWMGVTKGGRFACVTNVFDRDPLKQKAPSRGELVSDFLTGDVDLLDYLDRLARTGPQYNGYNLLFGTPGAVAYISNRGGRPGPLAPGNYGISNHLLDTPWPKVLKGKERLAALLRGREELPIEELFELLSDRTVAPDDKLPDVGLPIDLVRESSSIFADGKKYGTRCSTLAAIDNEGWVTFEERDLRAGTARRYRFRIDASA